MNNDMLDKKGEQIRRVTQFNAELVREITDFDAGKVRSLLLSGNAENGNIAFSVTGSYMDFQKLFAFFAISTVKDGIKEGKVVMDMDAAIAEMTIDFSLALMQARSLVESAEDVPFIRGDES